MQMPKAVALLLASSTECYFGRVGNAESSRRNIINQTNCLPLHKDYNYESIRI